MMKMTHLDQKSCLHTYVVDELQLSQCLQRQEEPGGGEEEGNTGSNMEMRGGEEEEEENKMETRGGGGEYRIQHGDKRR